MTTGTAELRETSGMTSRLVLTYAERQGGRAAVEEVLERAGCADREEELRDERSWFSFDTKIRLFEALAQTLDDPVAIRHAGENVLDLSVGDGLKVALRALGSPRLVYQHIVRANGKFSAIHDMELLALSRDRATIAFSDRDTDYGVHAHDCAYNQGLLSVVPALFGMGHAHVSHSQCAAVDDVDRCVYDLSWQHSRLSTRTTVAAGAAATTGLAATALAAPALLPLACGAALAACGAFTAAWARARRARWRQLEDELQDKELVSTRLAASLQDLVAELDVDELLEKIVEHAHAAVGSKEFLLLVAEPDGAPRARASTGVPPLQVARIERWVEERHAATADAVLIEDVGDEPLLDELPGDQAMPIGTVVLTPLMFRGAAVGHLLALAPAPRTFLPRDVDLVSSYAVQAAIALANARMFAAQRALATRDPLTSLLNHREFHESIDRELDRARRHGGETAVALFDLDGFKLVNDGAGHAEGDRVLRAVAAATAGACRASDLAFRIGGDEFALLLPETGREEARVVANRVREAIAGVDARVGASFGMAAWPDDGGSKDVLLAAADAALYAMKGGSERRRHAPARTSGAQETGAEGSGALMRERLAVASRLSSRLAPVLSPDEIARAAVAELHHAFDYGMAYVQRVDRETETLRTIVVGGTLTATRDVPLWKQSLQEGVTGRVARTGRVSLVHDTALDADHLGPKYYKVNSGLVLRSQLVVPLHVGGSVWGVLSLLDEQPSAFTSDDVLLLETVGAQVAAAVHRSELFTELDGAFATTLGVLCDALDAKDAATASHAHDVGELAFAVGVRLGLDDEALRELRYGAMLHDVGKIAVPTEILRKPAALTPEERLEIERHTIVGADMLARIPFFARVVPLVRSSHERWDGAGYPDRLAGDAIPLGARIVCACDAFDAMTTDRPYRAARTVIEAVAELRACAGTHFDPAVVDALAALVEARDVARSPSA